MTQIQKVTNETIDRLTSEPSPYFKPFQKIGLGVVGLGVAIKIVACFTPALPVALVSLAPEMIEIGLLVWGGVVLTKDQGKKDASVTTGKTGWKKAFAIVKNLL
jgi:hypothetical protein